MFLSTLECAIISPKKWSARIDMNEDSLPERLITQNLVAAAATYERIDEMTWSAVRQLAILIDLFCLHDRLAVLGRQAYSMLTKASELSALGLEIVSVGEFYSHPDLVSAACVRLATYLDDALTIEECRKLIEATLEASHIERAFSASPDSVEDFNTGADWLRTFPRGQDIKAALDRETHDHRSVTFFVRTFLYLTYAELKELPLTPDETRATAMAGIVRTEGNIRQRMREALQKAFPNRFLTDEIELTRALTPLASVVFDRAYPRRENIPKEIQKLRNELRPFRRRVQEAEKDLIWATGREEARAKQKWEAVYKEIEAEFGRGEGLVNVDITSGLSTAEAAARFAESSTKVSAVIKTLALPLDVLVTFLRRRPAIEIFHLGDKIPSSVSLKQTAYALFGHVRS
jgi:hypothetical protein